MCILYSWVPTHRHTIFDVWGLKNCCCSVDTSYTCWQCGNLVTLLCFDLIFRIRVSGHTMLAVVVFSCLVCLSSIVELQNFVERHFLCHQTVAHLPINELAWITSFFHCILCKLKLFCHSLKNVCDCCKLSDVIAVGMLASYLHPSFIVWYYFRHNLIA